MISGTPSLFVWSLSEPRPKGLESFVEQYARAYEYYGSGKAALHDGMRMLTDPGENVLVPSYLPDAVVEPFRELGLEARYYAVTDDLAPDLDDLQPRIDDDTAAVMSVNYFGFPQPGLDAIADLAADHDCYHVDDNAHSVLSVDDGTLLGTRGHLGIASLWKLLPVPNGALLYLNDESIARRFEPSGLAGTNARIDSDDWLFVLKSFAVDVLSTNTVVKQSVDAFVSTNGSVRAASEPFARYEAAKAPMSKLAAHVVADADPEAIRAARRRNYRCWRRLFEPRGDVEILYPELPAGICPQVFPVRADDPDRLLTELARCGVDGAHTWPRLSETVLEDPALETAAALSAAVVVLPVHQHIVTDDIEAVGRRLDR
ncbi:DegT/DnrJ/EryC1/StrS family aminotransferase [Natrononativus amylolyticus]|uniref:DegT/DnrJ/EryC1/StrS family aminotransferase n=1 Tax=Natrononativus amylolyticus TaxID=2963434 RepID=UPI0020CF3FDC|nr:DegT/DnrJ/EryC1/StrS family aminotransferase [Natrononativus amylolyticus]